MSWLSRKQAGASALVCVALFWGQSSKAEIGLVETEDWSVTTDGRINAFVTHMWGEDRPEGLDNQAWLGFNESPNSGNVDADGNLRRTRIRSGFVPSTLAFNVRRAPIGDLKLSARVELGMQITAQEPATASATDPIWLQQRSLYLDIAGNWGSVRAGRDLSLFSRGNLLMNYELGHAYGVGFPCAYMYTLGGACGHVGFGTLWPDFKAQITYTTPKFGDVVQMSAGIFDPRTVPTRGWTQIKIPRFESEAVADYYWREGWGFKAWANGAWQRLGNGAEQRDDNFQLTGIKVFTQDAYGVGGGVIGYLGPVKLGGSGYTGRGMDGFTFLTFNPVLMGLSSSADIQNEDREFRPSTGFLAEASVTFGDTWVMGGFGQVNFERVDSDPELNAPDNFPLPAAQRGISAGVFHRFGDIILGLDYFNAYYDFDPVLVAQADGTSLFEESEQTVHFVSGGVTLEW